MKKQSIRTVAANLVGVALIGLSGHALASDGTITFTGSIDASTCTITTTGTAGGIAVTMPKISAASLNAVGATSGDSGFSIGLSGCSEVAGNVSTYFESGTAVDTTTGRLNNTAATSAATGVQIRLLNDDGTVINVGAPLASQNSKPVALASDGAATDPKGVAILRYTAQYYATSATVGAGAVTSQVTYSMILP